MRSNCKADVPDMINHPPHYAPGAMEVIDVIEGFALDFVTGNVIKYVLRSPYKGAQLDDLRKAEWYLRRLIARVEKEQA